MKEKAFKMTRINILLLTICSLLIAGVIGYNDYLKSNKLYFVIEMEASTSGISQIFFDMGWGYNEQDSSALQVQTGAFRKYSFPLLATTIKTIRFDPVNVSAVVRVKDARIENNQGDIIKKFPLRDFRPIQQIDKMDTSRKTTGSDLKY